MRKIHQLAVLSLFLLVPASIICAQTAYLTGTVTMEQDYRTVNFSSPSGNVKVFLPGDLSGPGQGTVNITGTVRAEPAGKNEKEKANNLKALQKMVIRIGANRIPVTGGQNPFTISMPTNLTTPVPMDLEDPMGQRATVSLKNPVISPPPTTGSLPAGQPSLSTDQKIFLTEGNIPVYAANNSATLFQPTDKFFIRDAAGNMAEATKLTQSPTQTVLSGQGLLPGATTIVRQSGNKTDQVNVRMANLSLSSRNTNLRPGQTSSLTVTIDPKITDKDSAEAMQIPIMSLDIKNLTPGVVDMAGGNVQVMSFPTAPGSTSPAAWQATRTITGVTPGTFNISATLYPSSTISNNMANTQKRALENADEFNTWIEQVKRYLEDEIKSSGNNAVKEKLRSIINSLPYCNSADDLDICKTMADLALRFMPVPDLNMDLSGSPSLVAYQAATNHLTDQPSGSSWFVHTDVIQNGLNYLKNTEPVKTNSQLQHDIQTALSASKEVDRNYSPGTLTALSNAIKKINANPAVASNNDLSVANPISLFPPEEVDPEAPYPFFAWTTVFVPSTSVNYIIRIVPVFENQTAVEAINKNTAILTKNQILTSYQYLPSDPDLSLYPNAIGLAWDVRAVDSLGASVTKNNGKSEVGFFGGLKDIVKKIKKLIKAWDFGWVWGACNQISGCVEGNHYINQQVEDAIRICVRDHCGGVIENEALKKLAQQLKDSAKRKRANAGKVPRFKDSSNAQADGFDIAADEVLKHIK